jgi:hypothetical protein
MTEELPTECPNGHPFGPGRVLVGWSTCSCQGEPGGHRTVFCRVCGQTRYDPQHDGPRVDQPSLLRSVPDSRVKAPRVSCPSAAWVTCGTPPLSGE